GPFGVLMEGSQGMRNSWILAVTAALFPACAIPTTGSTVRSDAPGAAVAAQAQPAAQETAWDFNATIIEACSCPMFCQCYFNTQPADHPGCCPPNSDPKAPPRYCRFNNAFKVNHGSFGKVKLDGALFWVAGDLGGDFSKGEMTWAVAHFDPSVTKEQRDGISAALAKIYPVKGGSFTGGKDLPMEWDGGEGKSVRQS